MCLTSTVVPRRLRKKFVTNKICFLYVVTCFGVCWGVSDKYGGPPSTPEIFCHQTKIVVLKCFCVCVSCVFGEFVVALWGNPRCLKTSVP